MVIGIWYFTATLVYMSMRYDNAPTLEKVLMLLVFFASFLYSIYKEAKIEERITELETKVSELQPYFTPDEVRKMTPEEVRRNYDAIMKSMEKWN